MLLLDYDIYILYSEKVLGIYTFMSKHQNEPQIEDSWLTNNSSVIARELFF